MKKIRKKFKAVTRAESLLAKELKGTPHIKQADGSALIKSPCGQVLIVKYIKKRIKKPTTRLLLKKATSMPFIVNNAPERTGLRIRGI